MCVYIYIYIYIYMRRTLSKSATNSALERFPDWSESTCLR